MGNGLGGALVGLLGIAIAADVASNIIGKSAQRQRYHPSLAPPRKKKRKPGMPMTYW